MIFNKHSTHLMFIDSDLRFSAEDIFKLVDADQDLVGGLYPVKAYPIRFVVNGVEKPEVKGELEEVRHIGTGFMLIKRELLEKMMAAKPHAKYKDSIGIGVQYEPHMYALFETSVDENGHYMSEDWFFCDEWRKMGGKVWAHKGVLLNHTGFHEFKADPTVLQNAKRTP